MNPLSEVRTHVREKFAVGIGAHIDHTHLPFRVSSVERQSEPYSG